MIFFMIYRDNIISEATFVRHYHKVYPTIIDVGVSVVMVVPFIAGWFISMGKSPSKRDEN